MKSFLTGIAAIALLESGMGVLFGSVTFARGALAVAMLVTGALCVGKLAVKAVMWDEANY